METLSAARSSGDECGMAAPLSWKEIFCRVRDFVRLSLAFETFKYSHDRHAKKKAPRMSCVVARCVSVSSFNAMAERTQMGMAFFGFSFGSSLL